jgi:hypothetical protein
MQLAPRDGGPWCRLREAKQERVRADQVFAQRRACDQQ